MTLPTGEQIRRNILDRARVKLTEAFHRNFERKAFFSRAWTPRKQGRRGSLLVVSGRLRRSLRAQVIHSGIRFSSSMPYASAHNEGYEGPTKVPAHTRRAHAARRIVKGRARRVQVSAHAVRAHTKHLKLPERRFVGDAPEVRTTIEQCVRHEMTDFANQLTLLLKP
ncbi:phage virion morphogenesis protein [Porphyromonas loveana]|uniref:phage virion morphogenesis protein n=1 Tax=Porphyromonas loveana TaxID=1884669 RepID=UPI0035A111FF